MRCHRVAMAFLAPDSNGIELTSSPFSNVKNNKHGGLAIKTFGLALRSLLLHWSRHDLVSRFQPVPRSAATLVLKPSCTERSLKRAGERTSVESTAHISKLVLTRSCTDSLLDFPRLAFDVNTRSVNFSKCRVYCVEAQLSNCTETRRLDSTIQQNKEIGVQHVHNTHELGLEPKQPKLLCQSLCNTTQV